MLNVSSFKSSMYFLVNSSRWQIRSSWRSLIFSFSLAIVPEKLSIFHHLYQGTAEKELGKIYCFEKSPDFYGKLDFFLAKVMITGRDKKNAEEEVLYKVSNALSWESETWADVTYAT
jgi:hypothetical protein